jgi:hypothetical protein
MRSPTMLRPASGSLPQDYFRVQSRWTPRWPVLDGLVPTLLGVGRECQPLLNRLRQFRAECVRLVQSASGTSQAGRGQRLAVCFLRSRHSPPEDNPPSQSMSWISYSVGRFSGVHRWPVLGLHRGARYWGFTPRLCRPYRAQTKGKVESGVKYIRRNFLCGLQGREPSGLSDLNAHLREWVWEVANRRVHGTTHESVAARWNVDQLNLQPLDGQLVSAHYETRQHHPDFQQKLRGLGLDLWRSHHCNRDSGSPAAPFDDH